MIRLRQITFSLGGAAAVFALLAACEQATEPQRVPSSLRLDESAVNLDDGQSVQLRATVFDQNSQAFESLPAGVSIQWSSSAESIVSVSGTGLLSANRPGSARVTARAAGLSAEAEVTVRPVPTALAAVGGDGQSGVVGAALAQPITARVTDRHGSGVAGVAVQFVVAAGGGTVSAQQVATDTSGHARTAWTLGAAAGENRLEARVAGLNGSPAVFRATGADGAVPFITGISPALLTPGIGAIITGGNFSGEAAGNTVRIDGVTATVIQASPTELRISLPQRSALRCEPRRDVAVSVAVGGLQAAAAQHPLRVAIPRSLGVGESLRLLDAADLGCNELPAGGRYVISVFNTSTVLSAVAPFQLRGADGTGAASQALPSNLSTPRGAAPATSPASSPHEHGHGGEAHFRVLEMNRELLTRLGPPPRRSPAEIATRSVRHASVPGVGEMITLRVPDLSTNNTCTNFREIRARAVYSGPIAVVLEDSVAPLAGQMDELYREIGREYEQVMHPIVLANFGDPLAFNSQLSNDGRIFMVFSRLVNDFNVGGFVSAADLYPRSTCPSSDQNEAFYGIVPTTLDSGWSSATREGWIRFMRSTTIHEVKHIVSFAERLARSSFGTVVWEASWLEEATARLAEEMYGRRVFGYGQNANTTYQASIYCEVRPSWPECAGRPQVMQKHFGALHGYYAEIENLTPLGRAREGDWTFYASGWSLVRWAADQHGGSESAFIRALVQETRLSGVANLQARTGLSWAEMLADWTLASAVDDYPAFTAARPQLRLPSWNTRDVFAGLNRDFASAYPRAFPLAVRPLGYGNFTVDVPGVRAGSAAIFELSGSAPHSQALELRAAGGSPAATLRMAFVRVQ
jgi:hypothetical protein